MNTQATSAFRAQRSRAFAGQAMHTSYEWEELPSLAREVRRSDFGHSAAPVWNATRPLGLSQPAQTEVTPSPFREVLCGLHVREIAGAEVFQHFFGSN